MMDWANDKRWSQRLTFCLIPTSSLGDMKLKTQTYYTWGTKAFLLPPPPISEQISLGASGSLENSLWEWALQRKWWAHGSQCPVHHAFLSDQLLPCSPPQERLSNFLPSCVTPTAPQPTPLEAPMADQFPIHTPCTLTAVSFDRLLPASLPCSWTLSPVFSTCSRNPALLGSLWVPQTFSDFLIQTLLHLISPNWLCHA